MNIMTKQNKADTICNSHEQKRRCLWVTDDPLYICYHDKEWGLPVYNDQKLFEMITLEGAQAGLNWLTILKKRESFRKAFSYFDPEMVARYDEKDVKRLMKNSDIVRNKAKIRSTISNANAFLKLQREYICFSSYLWGFTNGKQIENKWQDITEVPSIASLSNEISIDMKRRGFSFFGNSICYAFMQAIGMVNDHTIDCFRHKQIGDLNVAMVNNPNIGCYK